MAVFHNKQKKVDESITQYLKPKSKEDILKSLDKLTPYEKLKR